MEADFDMSKIVRNSSQVATYLCGLWLLLSMCSLQSGLGEVSFVLSTLSTMTSERLIPFGSNPMLARIFAPDHFRPDMQAMNVWPGLPTAVQL
jgi:hypothetical protein